MNENIAELVLKVQNKDKSAFEEIFEIYKTSALRTAYLLTNNKTLSEDITQEAFVQCYLKINELKNPSQFRVWFFKILTRIAWKMNKKENFSIPVENIFDSLNCSDGENLEDSFIEKELSKEMMSIINKLDEKHRTTILLYYYKDFSVSEIANIMGCFEGTVKSRLYTARKHLKKSFESSYKYAKEVIEHEII